MRLNLTILILAVYTNVNDLILSHIFNTINTSENSLLPCCK